MLCTIDYAGKLFFAAKVPSSWISLYTFLCTASLRAPFSCWEGHMATGEPDPLFTFHCSDYTVKNNTTAGYCLQLFNLKKKTNTLKAEFI